ncbi:glycosyltransferase family 2 protein [Bacteroides ihuae]|uniref:glycosyltransferase family 2 protein n=1 Tax=Bacteroides ihuae TaxID=1852362 RepID=UPI0008DAC477|nr:glycosyltransferase family 2 protein [Bacteroides ihuae]
MSWYNKYIEVYEKPFSEAPQRIVNDVRNKLQITQSEEPLVTVSVIAYNEEKHLLACLWSLSEMQCKYPVEIIGVNNDSKDKTEEVFKALGIPYYNEFQHSCGYARRCGLEHAKGKYHINIDADSMYPAKYVETMVNKLEKPGIVAVSSLWSYIPDKQHSWIGLKAYELSRDLYLFIQSFKRPELSVRGLVFAYNTAYAKTVGIRVDIIRGEDGSLALGLKKFGKIAFVRSRKARAITGYGTVGADGSLLNSFAKRLVKGVRNATGLFFSKKRYKDKKSNLIK